ncbi:MAG: hypothetical protein ACRDP1_02030 [Nocardioidaceae bacterium]
MAEHSSRRSFLRQTSLGAAVVGVVATSPGLLAGAARADDSADAELSHGPLHAGALTVFVRDHRTGEIAVMVGEREVVHHDRALARRLARIAATAARP